MNEIDHDPGEQSTPLVVVLAGIVAFALFVWLLVMNNEYHAPSIH